MKMKIYRGDEVQTHTFLTTELEGNEWSGPLLGRCIPPTEIITATAFITFKELNISGVLAHSHVLHIQLYSK